MWPLRSIAYFIVFWVACVAALVNPIWGVVNYMFVYQANPTATWWGKPMTDMGMRFSLIAAGFTIVGLFTGRKHVPIVRPILSFWEVGIGVLILIAAVNLVIGVGYNDSSAFAFEKFWKVMLFVMILTRLASTRENLRMVVWTLVLGSMYLGFDAYTAPLHAFVEGRLDRVGGPDISTTSGAAAHLVSMLPIIGVALLTQNRWMPRLIIGLSGALVVNAIILCRTRSAFIGFAFGAVVALLLTPRTRRFTIYGLFIVGGMAGYSLTDDHFWRRMETLLDPHLVETDQATAVRKQIWMASLHIVADYPLGIGPGNFTQIIGDYDPRHRRRATHNSLVVCVTELGILGGVVFLMMVCGSVYLLYRSSRLAHLTRYPIETKIYAYGFFISFTIYFVTALGTQRFYCESFWWVLSLPLCLHRVVQREAASAWLPELCGQPAEWEEASLHGRVEPAL